MAKDPGRFQTPAEVAHALAPFFRKRGQTPAVRGTKAPVEEKQRSTSSSGDAPRHSSTQYPAELRGSPQAPLTSRAEARAHRRYLEFAVAAVLTIGLIAAWAVTRPRPALRPRPLVNPQSPRRRRAPEHILAEAEAAIRASNLPGAIERIDRYLANPGAAEADRASKMRLELLAATSDIEADLDRARTERPRTRGTTWTRKEGR